MTTLVSLTSGPLVLGLAPQIGGAITFLRHNSTDILRPMDKSAIQHGIVRDASSYPLLPYTGRIAHGQLHWGGKDHQLALNFGDHPHSIHGNGWQCPWEIDSQSATAATLVLCHRPFGYGPQARDGWPFRFTAYQSFALTNTQVRFEMRITNDDEESFPVGLGWHPYFIKHADMKLQFAAKSVWLNGSDVLPTERLAIPKKWNFSALKPVGNSDLDNIFAGWNKYARMELPHDNLALDFKASSECGYVVVYTPQEQNLIAFEPVTHLANSINMMNDIPDHGLKILEKGMSFSAAFTLDFRPLG